MYALFLNQKIAKKILIVCTVIFMGISIGVLTSFLSNLLPLIIVIALLFSATIILRRDLVLALMVWISFQNSIIPFLYSNTNFSPMIWTIIITIPFFVPLGITLFWILEISQKKGKIPNWMIVGILYFVIVTAFSLPYLTRGGGIVSTLYYYRSFLMPLLYVTVGYFYTKKSPNRFNNLLRTMSIITLVGAVFSIIDYFYIPPEFWKTTAGLGAYWAEVKQLDPSQTYDGLPLNFFTWSGNVIIRRAVSIYGDPLAAGYSMATGIVAWLLLRYGQNKNKSKLLTLLTLFIMLIGVAFTFTRAAYIIIAVLVIYLLLSSKKFRESFPKIGYIMTIGVFIYLGGNYIHNSIIGENSSAIIHANSVISIPDLLSHPFGTGMFLNVPEGTFQSILWTIGIIPVIAFIMWIRKIFPNKNNIMGQICRGMIWSLIISGFISYEVMGTSCSFAWAMIGGVLSLQAADSLSSKDQPEKDLVERS